MLQGSYNDDEIVVWTRGGFFNSTYEGAAQVALRLPGVEGRYSIRQFDSLLHRKGLAKEVLARSFRPPDVKLSAPPTVKVSITGSTRDVSIDIHETSGGPPRQVLVFQDGVLTDTVPADGKRDLSLTVARRRDAREITTLTVDAKGLSSLPMGRQIAPPAAGSGRRLVAIAIGVDTYKDARLAQLSYAASDAKRFADAIAAGSVLYKQVEVHLLQNAEATPARVLGLVRDTLTGDTQDADIMLFFAGHGLQSPDGHYYLGATGADPDHLADTAIPWDALAKLVAGSHARITVFLDACHSGLAGRGLFATNDGAVDDLLSAVPSGVSVFAASKGREQSLESGSAGGGVFTTALVDTLVARRKRYDRNADGIISASEAFRGIKEQVVEATKGAQTPWFARNDEIGDFPLF